MARGIYPECKTQEIVKFLKSRKFAFQAVANVQKKERNVEKITKNLPLFMLTLIKGKR